MPTCVLDEPLRGDLLLDADRIRCKTSSDAGAVLLLLRIEYLDEDDEEEEDVTLGICLDTTQLLVGYSKVVWDIHY